MSGKTADIPVRVDAFWARVDRSGGADACWPWLGHLDKDGYGYGGSRFAHRRAYGLLRGPIPQGLTIDHLCRNRACVNPGHLEAVTSRDNILRGMGYAGRNARKRLCAHGHDDWEPVPGKPEHRRCRPCVRAHNTYRPGRYKRRVHSLDEARASSGQPPSG